jgi:hypothetical protein
MKTLSLSFMGLFSWLLSACNVSTPTEQDYFGYDLPIDTITNILEEKQPSNIVPQEGSIQFFARDNFANHEYLEADGIGAIDTLTGQLAWQTPYPEEVLVSIYNKNDSSYISSEKIILDGNKLLCIYKHCIPPQQGATTTTNETFYKYIILDSKTGQLLKKDAMKLPIKEIEFVVIGNYWFIKNFTENTISLYNTATGDALWTYSQVFQNIKSVNGQTVSLFNDNLDNTWQITVLNVATGKPVFEKKIEDFEKHRITNIWCKDDKVLVDMGAAYEINPLGAIGVKYKTYTVAFDLKTTKPLWRTNFVKN